MTELERKAEAMARERKAINGHCDVTDFVDGFLAGSTSMKAEMEKREGEAMRFTLSWALGNLADDTTINEMMDECSAAYLASKGTKGETNG